VIRNLVEEKKEIAKSMHATLGPENIRVPVPSQPSQLNINIQRALLRGQTDVIEAYEVNAALISFPQPKQGNEEKEKKAVQLFCAYIQAECTLSECLHFEEEQPPFTEHYRFALFIESLLAAGQLLQAEELFAAYAKQQNEVHALMQWLQARIHQHAGNTAESILLFEQLAASEQQHVRVRDELARLHIEIGDTSRAGILYEMCIRLAPSAFDLYHAFAELFVTGQQYTDALHLYARYIEQHPEHYDAHAQRIHLLTQIGHIDIAKELLDEVERHFPSHVMNLMLRSEIAFNEQNIAAAQSILEQLDYTQLHPLSLKRYYQLKAQIQYRQHGLDTTVLNTLELALLEHRTDADLRNTLFEAWISLHNIEQAEKIAQGFFCYSATVQNLVHTCTLASQHCTKEFALKCLQHLKKKVEDTILEYEVEQHLKHQEQHIHKRFSN
jgi:tetratricopeptide (TPR) repeat protein